MQYYIFNDDAKMSGHGVPFLGTGTKLFNHDAFFAIVNVCTFLGDSVSRKLVYGRLGKYIQNPLAYSLLSLLGATLALLKIPLLTIFGMFFIFFANGAIYATTTHYIDQHVPKEYNLAALSTWLFLGDCGSVSGSNSWKSVYDAWVCANHYPHMCLPQH